MGTMNEILGNQAYLEILDYKADEWDNLVSGSSGSSLSAFINHNDGKILQVCEGGCDGCGKKFCWDRPERN